MNEELSLRFFMDSWELFREPALAGAVIGALLGFLGVYIVLRRMVFLSAALSQSAGLGVTLAFLVQIWLGVSGDIASPLAGAMIVTLLTTLLLTVDRGALGGSRDSMLGLAYLASTAGALAIGTRVVQELGDIDSILLGSAVVITPEDFKLVVRMALILGVIHLWWMKGFVSASFDQDGARVRGLPVRLLELVLFLSLAVAISVSTRVVGVLPVFAFSVLPAMAAVRVASNVPRALLIATVIGAISGFAGYLAAFRYQLPVGASQTLVAVAFVFVFDASRRAYGLVAGRLAGSA